MQVSRTSFISHRPSVIRVGPSQVPSIQGNSNIGSFSIQVGLFAYWEHITLFYFISDFLANEQTDEPYTKPDSIDSR
jgi:hypothetical protein